MTTTREDIKKWLMLAVEKKVEYVIVVCDTFNYEEYPVFVGYKENIKEKIKEYNNKNMQEVYEVYDLKLPMTPQLNEFRAYHI